MGRRNFLASLAGIFSVPFVAKKAKADTIIISCNRYGVPSGFSITDKGEVVPFSGDGYRMEVDAATLKPIRIDPVNAESNDTHRTLFNYLADNYPNGACAHRRANQ